MGSALDYLPAIALGSKATQITGVNADGFVAAGYASLIQSLTGAPPTLVQVGRKARVLLTPAQAQKMKVWFESQVSAGIKIAKSPSNLELDTGPFVIPVIIKYAVPAALAVFAIGWFAHSLLGKR